MRSFDHSSFSQAFGGPAQQWISYGTVDQDTKEAKAIQFVDDDGNPSPYGPLVSVTLQPSGVSIPCRVATFVAGNGEAEWFPFIAGDEVMVAIPEGDERGGAAIIGRFNQEIDLWPIVVAGQDSTKNTFGFRRMRTPFVIETAASYLIRSAKTGSQIGINTDGNIIVNDGDQGTLLIGAEALGLTSGDGKAFVQVFPPTSEVYLGADTATFLVSADESKFISQGAISFSTGGGAANGHAVTAEQVVAMIINLVAVLRPSFTTPPVVSVTVAAAVAALAAASPASETSPGGNFSAFPTIFGAAGAIASAFANPTAPIDPTGFVPGFGRPSFRL